MQTNVFLRDPIKIIVWQPDSKTGAWTSTVVVLAGGVPTAIQREIKARYQDYRAGRTRDSPVLEKWYGRKWRQKLRFVDAVWGGAPEDIDEPDETVITDDGTSVPASDAIDVSEYITDEKTETREAVTIETGGHTFLWNVTPFPEDKVSELKYRINRYLGIPIFRQHLWYMQGGQSFPMRYNILMAGSGSVAVDFWNQVMHNKDKDRILGIPVQMHLYRLKDSLKVEAYDNFTLIGNMYNQKAVTEYHLVDLESIIGPRRADITAVRDRYQLSILYWTFVIKFWPMMNVSVWEEYIEKRELRTSYPQLDPPPPELAYIDRQIDLSSQMYGLTNIAEIDQQTRKSLTSTTLKIMSTYRGRVVNFRSLFDLLECTAEMDAIRYCDLHESRTFILDKFRHERSEEPVVPGTMYIRLTISEKPHQKLDITLYPNATYTIRSRWGEDMGYGFTDINHVINMHVSPLIRQINALNDQIMYHSDVRFPLIDKSNVKYVDIAISIFWKNTLTSEEFKAFRAILDRFVAARIIQEKLHDRNASSYYFKKGMYELDPRRIEKLHTVDNYYAYMFNADIRQKWFMLFENVRVMTVTHRYSDIKIDISGIKEDEYAIFQQYVVLLLALARGISRRGSHTDDRPTKSLSNLKEQDPHLYNFRKIYGSDLVYSKICQKPYQPQIVSQKQYDTMSKSMRESTVQYFNFTTGTPAHYRCPDKRFPHLRFITGKHPLNYCLPCCKITTPSENPEDRQRKRHETCLREGKCEKKTVETSTSRYIMSYGKPIDVGRLSNLPEQTLEALFSDAKEDDNDSGSESPIEAQYYLYGIHQHYGGNGNVGYVHCLAQSMSLTIPELAKHAADRIRVNPEHFPLLSADSFATAQELCRAIMHRFADGSAEKLDNVSWNALFQNIARIYLGIMTVVFEDRNTVIQLYIPAGIRSYEDYAYPEHQYIIVLHNVQSGYWNPIYVIHKDIYFRMGIIETRMYRYQTHIVQLIMDIIKSRFQRNVQSDVISLDIMRRYTESRAMTIDQLLVSRDKLCYGVNVAGLGYVPVHTSYFRYDSKLRIKFGNDIQPPRHGDLLRFVDEWNIWVAKRSQEAGFTRVDVPLNRPLLERVEPIYPFVKIEQWLQTPNGRVSGFVAAGMNWYIQSISPRTALEARDIPVLELNYDPLEINGVLESRGETKDRRTERINQALYDRYLYKLFILQFINLFNQQRNLRVRNEVKTALARGDLRTNLTVVQTEIAKHVQNTDLSRINVQISDYMSHGDRKLLLRTFDDGHYDFDRSVLEKLKTMPRAGIVSHLTRLAAEIIQPGTPTVRDFPNILSHCSGQDFCRGKKLIMPAARIREYVDILADQIRNPYVEKYIFSPLFATRIIDFFKFVRHPGESVSVEFV